jgi:hypothetical protein
MTEQKDHNLDLNTPVQFIKGVGPKRAQSVARLGKEKSL